MTEQELITALKSGNDDAFKWLVNQFSSHLYNVVFNILLDKEETEDVVQETFIKVYQSVHGFEGKANIKTWMYQIAVRKSIDIIRKRQLTKKILQFIPWRTAQEDSKTTFYHPGIALENKEKAAALFKAVEQLPEKQRVAFTLIKLQQMKYEDGCKILNVSTKALESLVNRAKINLQKMLREFYNNNQS